jgi:hypothetical protein
VNPQLRPSDVARFWGRVVRPRSKTKCWKWRGAKVAGYGVLRINGENFRANRLSYFLHKGAFNGDLCVLHRCDNPECANPKHLFLGTRTDNAHDKMLKGRQPKGSKAPGSKITERDVLAMFAARKRGDDNFVLAKRYGLHPITISRIFTGKRWAHMQRFKTARGRK